MKPEANETKVGFVMRCFNDPEMVSAHSDDEERFEVCLFLYEEMDESDGDSSDDDEDRDDEDEPVLVVRELKERKE